MQESELQRQRPFREPCRRAEELERWFATTYLQRLSAILRYKYLGIEYEDTRYALEKEAYTKEQELRALYGKDPLPEFKTIDLF